MNIFNFIKNNTAKVIFGCVIASTIMSCDPTIDSLSFDLPGEDSKVDLTPPAASFSFFQTFNEEANQVLVTVSNSSTNASMYQWDFGNGQESMEENFTAAYENPETGSATFEITLVATDDLGASDTVSSFITVFGEEREPQLIDDYILVNTGEVDDPVHIEDFSSEQGVDFGRTNFASNLLDKDGGDGGVTTVWTSNDDAVAGTGDGMGDGEYVIIDLGSIQELGLIRFKTDSRTRQYGYQILTSTTGTADADFSFLIPETATTFDISDWDFTESAFLDWQNRVLTVPTEARFVKLIAYGRYNVSDLTDFRLWSNWAEIEFYRTLP